jgi:hypothetical protein
MDGSKQEALFSRYPQLNSLRRLAPDSVIYEEIGSRVNEFEQCLRNSQQLIPTVNLNAVFPSDLENGSIRLENFLGEPGNVLVEEVCKICLIAKWLSPKRILEIGTYNGMTTLQMALNVPPECIIYTLDLTPDQAAAVPLRKLDQIFACNQCGAMKGSYFLGRPELHIQQLFGNSAEFDFNIIDSPIDLIFIDGAHDYKSVRTDTATAFRLLSEKGVILWHNYADIHAPDVTRCLIETAQNHRIWHLRNTYLAVYFAPNDNITCQSLAESKAI